MKKISSILDFVFSFANVNNVENAHLLSQFINQEDLLFPKTDKIWGQVFLNILSQDDSVNLLTAFKYEINDYLQSCKKENPQAYNARQMHVFWDEDVFAEDSQPEPQSEPSDPWGYTDEDAAWLPDVPLARLEEAIEEYEDENGIYYVNEDYLSSFDGDDDVDFDFDFPLFLCAACQADDEE